MNSGFQLQPYLTLLLPKNNHCWDKYIPEVTSSTPSAVLYPQHHKMSDPKYKRLFQNNPFSPERTISLFILTLTTEPQKYHLFKISISFTKSCAKAVSQRRLLYVCTVPPHRLSFRNQMQIHDGLLITPLLTSARGERNIHLSLGSKAAADQTCIFIRGHHLGMPGITGDCQSRCFQNTYSTAHQASFWTKSDRRKSSCTWEPSDTCQKSDKTERQPAY